MLSYVEVENFRGFERFRLAGLSRVNLLVGENNCGKSSLLEAVHFLASGGDLSVLLGRARDRGEYALADNRDRVRPVVTHFFLGHELRLGNRLRVVGAQPLEGISVWVEDAFDMDLERGASRDLQKPLFHNSIRRWVELALCIGAEGQSTEQKFVALPMSETGVIHEDAIRSYSRSSRQDHDRRRPVMLVSPESLDSGPMSSIWDQVLMDGREAEAVEALRILENRLTGIFFLASGSKYGRADDNPMIVVQLEGQKPRVPLGSYGDGMRRLLALSLALIQCGDGVLLIDEIDTGLHYSIMAKMWHLVVAAARRANIQVFATTHSSDCVRGLAQFCREHPELQQEVSLQKISCELEDSVALHAEEIVLADQQGMEVR
jgi:putative AbiEii toxin of type IV toxin-antitoxin system/AAA ATPase-like protein